jgi:hypothetical protein
MNLCRNAATAAVAPHFAAVLFRGAITDLGAAEVEYELVYKVIAYLLKKEGLITVTGAPKRQEREDEDSFRERLLKERRLTLSANFVPE